jgi:cysteine desulfurase
MSNNLAASEDSKGVRKAGRPVYLDYNATTPHDPEVIAAMRPFLEEHFGNPSSTHGYGVQTRGAVEEARYQVAALLNCMPEEIVFTSGGTESNNYAIKGLAWSLREQGSHIVTCQIEHPAVLEVCKALEQEGFRISYLPVNEFAELSVLEVEKALCRETILITIMHANNEVGTIQPIEEIARLARQRGIVVHTDAAQSAGKIPTDVKDLAVDLLSIAGHKLYAPKGVGALYVRKGVQLARLFHGAGQERGWRPGTENVLEIVGLGKACEIARRDLSAYAAHMEEMRDRLEQRLLQEIRDVKVNGPLQTRLPNTLSISFRGVDASALLIAIQLSVAVSAGAACHSGGVQLSHVLKAMHLPAEWAQGTIRLSTGRTTTPTEIEMAVQALKEAVFQTRNSSANIHERNP